jgi:hypothetical protein
MRLFAPLWMLGSLTTAVVGLPQPHPQAPPPGSTSIASANAGMVTQFHEFENGTWIESIAVRANGQIIVSLFDRPELYIMDPATPGAKPELIHRFKNATRLTGLAEYAPDKFAVLVGSRTNEKDSISTWTVDLSSINGLKVNAVGSDIPGVDLLNGLTALNRETLLASDTFGGSVYRIDVKSGAAVSVLNDGTMIPGVNGVHYSAPYLYYTNMIQGLFARIPVDAKTAEASGPAEIIATKIVGVDGFALASWTDHEAYILNHEENTILKVDAEANVVTFATGVIGPTAAFFGRTEVDGRILYVVTSGGANGGGKVMMVQT